MFIVNSSFRTDYVWSAVSSQNLVQGLKPEKYTGIVHTYYNKKYALVIVNIVITITYLFLTLCLSLLFFVTFKSIQPTFPKHIDRLFDLIFISKSID